MKVKATLSKYAPEILTGLGIVLMGSAGIMYVTAHSKNQDLAYRRDLKVVINESFKDDEEGLKKYERTYRLKKAGWWAIPIGMSVTGAACILCGMGILKKRYIALGAAYTALEGAFSVYRSRVIDKYGEEDDLYFMTGAEKKKMDIETINETTGEVMSEKQLVYVCEGASPYAKIFDRTNVNWEPSDNTRKSFLTAIQNYSNDRLHAKGKIFLNEIYEQLGFEKTLAGQCVGWIDGEGDNCISFGLEKNLRTTDGDIILDFNCQGNIIERAFDKLN